MIPKTVLVQLLAEVGPLLDLEGIIAFDEESLWTLAVDDETLVLVECQEAAGQLLISAEIAPLPPGSGASLLETLLIYNDQHRRTGGIRLALDGPGGAVIQSLDLAVADLDASKLTRVVQNFTALLRLWREILNSPEPLAAARSAAGDNSHPDGIEFGSGIRV